MKTANVVSTGILALLAALMAQAQTPQLLNYQGRVSVNGTNFTGNGQFKFALINNSSSASRTASGNAALSYGFLVNVTVTDGGAGYITAPSVTATGGGGSGAVLVAQISGGVVTNVVVSSSGSGYTSAPSIQFSGPPATYASLWSNDGTSVNGSQPSAAVVLGVTNGLYSVLLGNTTVGNMTALSATVFTNSDVRLRVWFNDGLNGFQQLTPDQRIAAVGYALMAGTVPDGSITASKLAPGAGGSLTTQIPATTNIQTAANSSYILTNDSAASALTLPAIPIIGDKIRIAGNAFGFTLSANPGQTITGPMNAALTATAVITTNTIMTTNGYPEMPFLAGSADGKQLFAAQNNGGFYVSSNNINQWKQTSQVTLNGAYIFEGNWTAVASSTNGTRLVAAIGGGSLYTSTNSGTTWIRQTSAPAGPWAAVASSADGTRLIAVQNPGGIYTSSNFGTTWTLRSNAPTDAGWEAVASSYSGSRLVALQSPGGIYTSSDYGVTWTQQSGAPEGPWQSVASSADGSQLTAGQTYGNYEYGIYTSSDYGVTWTNSLPGPWSVSPPLKVLVTASADGSRLLAAYSSTWSINLYLSADYGVTWIEQTGTPSGVWQSIASSSDNSKVVSVIGGNIFRSIDYGASWTQITHGIGGVFQSIASSSDGRKLVAAQSGGAIYASVDYGATWLPGTIIQQATAPLIGSWTCLACSTNGQRVYLSGSVPFGEGRWRGVLGSTNYGISFTLLSNSPSVRCLASSSDGARLVAGADGGIYTSTNLGINWVWQTNLVVSAVASSADGSKLVAGSQRIYTSTNSGAKWTLSVNSYDLSTYSNSQLADFTTSYVSILTSSESSKIVAFGMYSFGPYQKWIISSSVSSDFGNSWKTIPSPAAMAFSSSACSADCTRLIVLGNSTVYTSPDLGESWESTYLSRTSLLDVVLHAVVSSPDGTRAFVSNGSSAYVFQIRLYSGIRGKASSSCELVYVGNGRWQVINSSGTISGL